MPQEITYIPTCQNCPLMSQELGRNRGLCTAEHNHHNPVVRLWWQATNICEDAIAQFHDKDSSVYEEGGLTVDIESTPCDDWLTEPIGSSLNAIFGVATNV